MESFIDPSLKNFEYIWNHNVSSINNSTLKHFYETSLCNVELKLLPRKKRTAAHVLPLEPLSNLPVHTKEMVHFYTSDYVVVQHGHELDATENVKKELKQKVYHEYEVDFLGEKIKQISNDPPAHISSSVMKDSKEQDHLLLSLLHNESKFNKNVRSSGRQTCLFTLRSNIDDDTFKYLRVKPNVPEESINGRILIECNQLKLELEVEPIYASMALYDLTTKKKLSENFHFDMNSESLKKMLPTYDSGVADASTLSRSAIFRISHPTSGLYLLIRLEKVLQGDVDKCSKPYLKQPKSSDKLKEKTALYCWRLGKYRMPFAWTAISVKDLVAGSKIIDNPYRRNTFESKTSAVDGFSRTRHVNEMKINSPWSKNLDTFSAVTLKLRCFFKQEIEYLSDIELSALVKQASSRKKQDLIPGSFQLRISPCPTEMKCCLSPEMVAINPCPGENNLPIRELLEFPYKEINEPYLSYRNLMYIYPKNFSAHGRQGQIRNITVKVELREIGQQASIPLIYGRSSGPKLVSKMYTAVSYHKRNPDFYDEIKLSIPGNFNRKYFILFEFFHLNCNRKSDLDVEKCFGFSWIPLFINGKLTTGSFDIPVIKGESLVANFDELPVIKSGNGMENQKGIFKVILKAMSSVHPFDDHVDMFLKSCSVLKEISFPKNTGNVDANAELIFSIVQLPESDTRCLVKFLPILLNKIIWLIINSSKSTLTEERVGKRAFKTLVQIVNKVALHGSFSTENYVQNTALVTFVHYQSQISHVRHEFNLRMNNLKSMQKNLRKGETQDNTESYEIGDKCYESENYDGDSIPKLLHEELLFHLNNSERNTKELALNNIWFYFDLIIKSVIEDLHWMDKLNAPRESRVSEEFMKSTSEFLEWILINTHQNPKSEEIGTHLVISVAHFLCDLLCLVNRGWVFSLIKNFSNKIPADLQMCKLDFLQVICCHHQFIPLTLFGGPSHLHINGSIDSGKGFTRNKQIQLPDWATFDTLYDLSSNFKSNHFLAGLLLVNFQHFLTSGNPSLHEKSIFGMYNIINKLDRDPRYQDPSGKAILASLFYPIVGITMRALPRLKTEDRKSEDSVSEPEHENVRNSTHGRDRRKNVTKSSFFLPVDFKRYSGIEENLAHFSFKETCGLLMCFIWVMKNIDKKIFKLTLSELSPTRTEKFLEVLAKCLICFEYKERKLVCKKKYSTSLNNLNNLDSYSRSSFGSKRIKSELITGNIFSSVMNSNRRTVYEPDRSGEFSAEVTLIILDCLEMIAEVFSGTKDEKIYIEMVFKTLLEVLGKNQSTSVLDCIFYSQRSFVRKFPHLFYDDESDLCKDLSLKLLCHCSSILGRVRAQASLSLYLLVRESYQTAQKFSWIKLQLTVALSNLVDTSSEIREEKFHESLKNVVKYAEADNIHKDTQFPSQVKELIKSLHVIVSDTIKMKESQPDTDLVLDLMHRIADAHRSSPNARLTWLFHMAQRHNENEGHAEAAMCMIHGSAIVAEYMGLIESKNYLPRGVKAFENISPNVLEESLNFEDIISIEEDGLGKYFTESGLVGLLELAATSFFQAKLYEAMNAVYKIMIPIAEAKQNYKKLANIHSKLYDAFTLIEKNKNKRVFGSFYRVAFYGNSFGELNGNEFIYKEPTLTKLSEIFNRLQTFYQERFGAENVIIVKDSNLVDENTLTPNKLYIQITYVEPYFEIHELGSRISAFDKNFTIKKFVYATPFTPHGRPHGSIGEQWIRKTFLTTSHHFPYIKRRIPVIEKDEVVLTPIEVAIENIRNKTSELAATVSQEPPDAKMLQMVLQGCIDFQHHMLNYLWPVVRGLVLERSYSLVLFGTTVNQGPKEVAVVFLSDLLNENAKPTNLQNKLRDSFKDFARYCYDGLKKNEKIILPEQLCYQQELEKNFWRFIDYLEPLTHIKVILDEEKGIYFRKEAETEC